MNTAMKPETLDRTDPLECVIDNIMHKCHDDECRKAVLRHFSIAIGTDSARSAELSKALRESNDFLTALLREARSIGQHDKARQIESLIVHNQTVLEGWR